jgi:polygalacturonase
MLMSNRRPIVIGCAVLLIASTLLVEPARSAVLVPDPQKVEPIVDVKQMGAKGDGQTDDTAAIQAAIDGMTGGGTLVFPEGTYMHSRSIKVANPGVKLWGYGARLHAVQSEDMTIQLLGANTAIYGFTLTAVTETRRGGPTRHRIMNTAANVEVIDNHVNGSTATGIFSTRSSDYIIARNRVENSLADAIHNTGGCRNGRIFRNVVRNAADDMIAVVSYRKQVTPVSNILIEDNDVADNVSGRGITVVGGENVTIRNNRISGTFHSAAVYIHRELSFDTQGVRNILVEGNTIEHVQTTGMSKRGIRTGHAGVNIRSHGADGDPALTVERVLIRNNTIFDTLKNGINVLGNSCNIGLENNKMAQIGGVPIHVSVETKSGSCSVACIGNTLDGAPIAPEPCVSTLPDVTGALIN